MLHRKRFGNNYNLLGKKAYQTPFTEFNILKALKPQINSVSPTLIYLDEPHDGTFSVKGLNLLPESVFILMRLANKEQLSPLLYQPDERHRNADIIFDEQMFDTGDYVLKVTNPGGFTSEIPLLIKFIKWYDLTISAGYSPLFILADETILTYFNTRMSFIGGDFRITFIPLKRRFGYVGVSANLLYHRMAARMNTFNINMNILQTYINAVYQYPIIKGRLVIDIHGGAWIYGDKDLNDNFCYHLAKEGFNVISLSYTLGFKAKNINQIQEIHFLMNYLYENKDRYHLDFDNLFVTGDSAGGQLTFLYALIISNNDLFKDIFKCYNYNNLKINAIAVNHGAPYLKFDKLPPSYSNFTARLSYTSKLKTAYGHFYKFKKVYRATDPNETLRAITHFVPTIILSSRGDNLSYQSSLLDEEMTRCRFDHTYYFYNDESKGHVFNVLFPQSEEGKEFNSQIINYFRTYIK